MPFLVIWLGLVSGAAFFFRMSRAFRTGRDRRRLELYRDARRSALTRNLVLVGEGAGWFVAPGGLVAFVVILASDSLPRMAVASAFTVFFGYVLFVASVAQVLAYRPPRWLIPDWLRDDDHRVGWVAPKPNVPDQIQVAINVSLAVASLVMIALGTLLILQ